MEKYVAARNKKVSSYIHADLCLSILSNLSLKSLKRFECVCKSWIHLLENPNFKSLVHKSFLSNNRCYYDDSSILIHQDINNNQSVMYSISGERFENRTKLDWPNPFQEDDPKFYISGSNSIKGIFCLINYSQPDIRVVLWNPTTGEFKVVPTSPNEFVPDMDFDAAQYGFGYDSFSDDYKVIQCVLMSSEDLSLDPFWEIYSLKSNSWKQLEFDIPINYQENGVSLEGVFYWYGENEENKDDEAYIFSFDLNSEIFVTTPLPLTDDNFDFHYVCRGLVVLNGSIALISNYTNINNFHVAILGEIGMKESWVKLFIVPCLPCIKYPIGTGKNGDIFFMTQDGKLVYYDLSTQIMEELSFQGNRFMGKIITYKRILLPIRELDE
ncbi:F-box/kelch-repeat protein At3g06240-like [Vicia villosa]|uniref:F-box/kelch-repeat protein At3g06240-like n=1 Tax=Vicia villosa TaxID=3911 RepID=UPI00273B9697|nr:F-box/kelch-repeat protein At3g06240-like [Vicia villosa]